MTDSTGDTILANVTAWRYNPDRPLVHTHIPKCAGTSMQTALALALRATPVLGWDLQSFGTFDDWPSVAPEWRARVVGQGLALPSRPVLVAGEFTPATTMAAYPDGQHVTLLREPRSRLVSLWDFLRTKPPEDNVLFGSYGTSRAPHAQRGLAHFLAADLELEIVDNQYVRMLLWGHPLVRDGRPIDERDDEELLDAAVDVLLGYAHLDVLENPAWPARFEAWLGRPFAIGRANETRPSPAERRADLRAELTPAALELMARWTRLDRELWEHVLQIAMPEADPREVADTAFEATVDRHAALLDGG